MIKHFCKQLIVRIMTFEARLLLQRTKPKIIAITGSVGKTSTKDAIYEVLKKRMTVRKSEKSYNSEIGVPLSILGLPNAWSNPFSWIKNIIDGAFIALHPGTYPQVLILEMGVDRPGDMEQLTEWIIPDVVVLTRLPDVPVHVEFFGTPEAVAAEKKKLVEALRPDGVLVYNHDDAAVLAIAETLLQSTIGYSRYAPSQYTVTGDRIRYDHERPIGMDFTITHMDTQVEVHVQGSLGIQHAYNFAAAAAVGSLFEVPLVDAAAALASYEAPPGRMRILPGIKDTVILDDSYNASPVAVQRSLETLKELKGVRRRIAVLGDMMELGQYSVREHERVGEWVSEVADMLITVGVRARGVATGALEYGMSEKNILQYDDAEHAGKELQQLLEPGDAVLVKGSQSVRLERLVEEIMAEPERAEELLVRQGGVWRTKR